MFHTNVGPSCVSKSKEDFFMSNFFVTADGGLTTAGYAACVIAAILLFVIAGLTRKETKNKLSTKQLVYCGTAMALSFITSYIKVFEMPYGGSVTLFSMLFICLIGYWYGIKTGIMTGLAYGILQFIQEPYVLSLFQVCCDYVLAFAGLGLAGVFKNSKNGLIKGYILGILVRGLFHAIGGYLYWMDYMPENFPAALTSIYPIVYNYSYILAEGVITVIILCLPPVKKALASLKTNALS